MWAGVPSPHSNRILAVWGHPAHIVLWGANESAALSLLVSR
jgi:hypothetical protein